MHGAAPRHRAAGRAAAADPKCTRHLRIAFHGLYGRSGAASRGSPCSPRRSRGRRRDPVRRCSNGSASDEREEERPVTRGSKARIAVGDAGMLYQTAIGLPGLERYARLITNGGETVTASLEAQLWVCNHRCRHCPVPSVSIAAALSSSPARGTVLEDATSAISCRRATRTLFRFADPDFLQDRPRQAAGDRPSKLRTRSIRRCSFDATIKVSHLLRYEASSSAKPRPGSGWSRLSSRRSGSASDHVLEANSTRATPRPTPARPPSRHPLPRRRPATVVSSIHAVDRPRDDLIALLDFVATCPRPLL